MLHMPIMLTGGRKRDAINVTDHATPDSVHSALVFFTQHSLN